MAMVKSFKHSINTIIGLQKLSTAIYVENLILFYHLQKPLRPCAWKSFAKWEQNVRFQNSNWERNTSDIAVIGKNVSLIDVAIPGDGRIDEKQQEKITKYHDIQIEVEVLQRKKLIVLPIAIDALSAIP